MLTGLLIDAKVYTQQCKIHGVQPQGPLTAVPLPSLEVDQAAGDVGPLDQVDFSVRALTIQCACLGVTPGLVSLFLATWAHSFIEACPISLPTPPNDHVGDNEPEATCASTPMDKATNVEDTQMAKAEPNASAPLLFAHASMA